MDKNKGILNTIKGMFSGSKDGPPDKKGNKKNQYFLLLLAVGIAFMLISNLFSGDKPTSSVMTASSSDVSAKDEPAFGQQKDDLTMAISKYEDRYENELKEALEAIAGVEDVIVSVSVDATETKILEKNTVTQSQITSEEDRDGGKRQVEDITSDEQVVIIRSGDSETPIILKIEKPDIRSVLIVAKGVENAKIKQMVVEAVTKGFDVPNHKVAVVPRKTKGDS
ncbi:stage III sporulation protein AG [Bacillus sp. HNG]|uniref:stage III sporulation protein AG n=1 Tax=Bacillaceae TaxID=186817 RepID=UPI000E2FE64E|nr:MULTISPECIES: stage III sporulation protein AG [Bacillaceae]MDR4888880.1 stage III sporulation protein AG [Fredinandcohnia sp. QZ13]RFB17125.1 stage III sporulation protein AG [Bacillus sp. HNG]